MFNVLDNNKGLQRMLSTKCHNKPSQGLIGYGS